jgi:hypothetical protein
MIVSASAEVRKNLWHPLLNFDNPCRLWRHILRIEAWPFDVKSFGSVLLCIITYVCVVSMCFLMRCAIQYLRHMIWYHTYCKFIIRIGSMVSYHVVYCTPFRTINFKYSFSKKCCEGRARICVIFLADKITTQMQTWWWSFLHDLWLRNSVNYCTIGHSFLQMGSWPQDSYTYGAWYMMWEKSKFMIASASTHHLQETLTTPIEGIYRDCITSTHRGFFDIRINHRFFLWWVGKKCDVIIYGYDIENGIRGLSTTAPSLFEVGWARNQPTACAIIKGMVVVPIQSHFTGFWAVYEFK